MRLKKYLFIFLFILPLAAVAQNKSEGLIDWNPSKRLNWSDYKADPDPKSDAAATTTSYLGIEYNFRNNKITYTITCCFSQARSWGRHKTDHILGHEQGHFDITEIFARKLNQRMSRYEFNRNTYQKDLKDIYDSIQAEKEDMQNLYDDETDFSRNYDKQAEWLKKIEKLLKELEGFAGYER